MNYTNIYIQIVKCYLYSDDKTLNTIIIMLGRLMQQKDVTLTCSSTFRHLKVIYHPLYSMNNFVTNKSKLPQDGAQVFPYMG